VPPSTLGPSGPGAPSPGSSLPSGPQTSTPAATTPQPTSSTTSPTTSAGGGSRQTTAGSGGPVQYTYRTEAGDTGSFYSDRDCGWSTAVSGRTSSGQNVSRALWAFCDSVGYVPETGQLWSEAGVPSSSYGLAPVGANPTVDAVVSPARSDGAGKPLLLNELMTRPEESCGDNPAKPYPREWARGLVTLPDNDPAVETVLVFYQNFCIAFGNNNVDFGAGGVALVQWDANNPDGELRREKLNDAWFLPGQTTDERSAALYASYSYGSGPVLAVEGGTTYLYSYLCGAGGDCTVARVSIDPNNPAASARRVADTANWRYRTASGSWTAFPAAEAWGTCAPTVERNCGGYPAPAVVADADRTNILSTPAAEPSLKQARGRWYLLYSAGLDNGQLAYRVANSPIGPFSEPRLVTLGAGHCTLDCRAAFWQPSADRDGLWAISYYDEHGLDGLVDNGNQRRRGRIMVTYVDPAAFR
jgi:hypothetical protein